MKIYLKNSNRIVSEKIKLENIKSNEYDQLFSNEGIYIYKSSENKIKKLIIENDNVYELGDILVDDSKIKYIEHHKIPLQYKVYKVNEKIYNIDDKVDFVIVNNNIYYFKCNDIEYFKKLYIEICNKVFI